MKERKKASHLTQTRRNLAHLDICYLVHSHTICKNLAFITSCHWLQNAKLAVEERVEGGGGSKLQSHGVLRNTLIYASFSLSLSFPSFFFFLSIFSLYFSFSSLAFSLPFFHSQWNIHHPPSTPPMLPMRSEYYLVFRNT